MQRKRKSFDVQTIRCPIRRICKRMDGLYSIHLGVQTIDNRFHPIMATGTHEIPTMEGLKKVENLKKNDVILLSLNLLTCQG